MEFTQTNQFLQPLNGNYQKKKQKQTIFTLNSQLSTIENIVTLILCLLFGINSKMLSESLLSTTVDLTTSIGDISFMYLLPMLKSLSNIVTVVVLIFVFSMLQKYSLIYLSSVAFVSEIFIYFVFVICTPLIIQIENNEIKSHSEIVLVSILAIADGIINGISFNAHMQISSLISFGHVISFLLGIFSGQYLVSSIDSIGFLFKGNDHYFDFITMGSVMIICALCSFLMLLICYFKFPTFKKLITIESIDILDEVLESEEYSLDTSVDNTFDTNDNSFSYETNESVETNYLHDNNNNQMNKFRDEVMDSSRRGLLDLSIESSRDTSSAYNNNGSLSSLYSNTSNSSNSSNNNNQQYNSQQKNNQNIHIAKKCILLKSSFAEIGHHFREYRYQVWTIVLTALVSSLLYPSLFSFYTPESIKEDDEFNLGYIRNTKNISIIYTGYALCGAIIMLLFSEFGKKSAFMLSLFRGVVLFVISTTISLVGMKIFYKINHSDNHVQTQLIDGLKSFFGLTLGLCAGFTGLTHGFLICHTCLNLIKFVEERVCSHIIQLSLSVAEMVGSICQIVLLIIGRKAIN